MSATSLDLAGLVGARICHDLSSPLGAISNGVELLAMTGPADGPELALVSESAEGAVARLRFLRLAFGCGSAEERVGPEAMASLLGSGFATARLAVTWDIPGAITRDTARLAALLLLCAEKALPAGGTIRISGDVVIEVAAGGRLSTDPRLWEGLSGPDNPEVTPSTVQFALAREASQAAGRPIRVRQDNTRIEVQF